MKVLVWNENRHEQKNPKVREVYPEGIHGALRQFLEEAGHDVSTATLDEENHGLSDARLDETDVLLWWGHLSHDEVSDAWVEKVKQRVLEGMGLLVLHSGHFSKIFKTLMGTSCDLKWREADETERLWVVDPTHPIVEGIGSFIELEKEEMYGEHFDIPTPDELLLLSWFEGGEVFRSGVTYKRGRGKIFYFRPGHETYPTYHQPQIQQVIKNAVNWLAVKDTVKPTYGNHQPIASIKPKG
ncbi:trehalose utilization protein [Streptohalobacillus salinus]|uniref:Trehalose utilization protein n=2 Tax=Streptohalobacillus salinus TaxID=621096 RepID=A0A2V3WFS9_9BACI|nr:trehalose utilization protein [Streptohalobacillus salinus]